MAKRLGVAGVLIFIVLLFAFVLREISLIFADVIIMSLILFGGFEMYNAFKKAGYLPIKWGIIVTVCIIYPLSYFFNEGGVLIAIFAGVIVSLAIFIFSKNITLNDFFVTIFNLLYPIGLTSLLLLMNNGYADLLGILLVLFIACITDSMAYFVGITFKGKKLCPRISPKKTISGAIGGLFGGVIGAMITFVLFDVCRLFDGMGSITNIYLFDSLVLSGIMYAVIGAIGGVLAQFGDLSASWIKRKTNIKDFGTIFPGHGGVVDRLDSIVFVLPFVYFVFKIIELV